MSGVSSCEVDIGKQYRLPGVEPPRAPATTFSAQRYDPLRLPPTLSVGDGMTEPTFHDVEEMVLAKMPHALMNSLAFPPPRAVLSQNFTRLDGDANTRGGRETWARKLYNSYENAEKSVCSVKRRVTACLLASGTAICHTAMRVVRPFIAVARDMVPGRIFIIPVAVLDGH